MLAECGVVGRLSVETGFEGNLKHAHLMLRRVVEHRLGLLDPVPIYIVEEMDTHLLVDEFGKLSLAHS